MSVSLPGYTVTEQIYESTTSVVYRARREKDQKPLILKVLKQDYPTPEELVRYRQEYEIARSLEGAGMAQVYGQEGYQNTLIMLVEDFGGDSLHIIEKNSPSFELEELLTVFTKICQALGEVHHQGVIHKDICPGNVVLNRKSGQVKLIDFGISTRFSRTQPILKNPDKLEGTLAYIAPEQTGRMNRSLDHRADFYALGVTLYEMLCGRRPFTATDPLELIYCHIAKEPQPPHDIDANIPEILSDIVLKLMSKGAEERYQSAWGIAADLQECIKQLQQKNEIDSFSLESHDISEWFEIPQKLYGREKEVTQLLYEFDKVSEGAKQSLLVAGYSGIGKTALVHEVHKPITRQHGYFISGKFDQFKQNIPYFAIVSALQEMMQQLLTERPETLARWKEKLSLALGENAQVLIDVIPELETIIGKQPHVEKLLPIETQNRFNRVFQRFMRVLCQANHPLVMFIDDLQWIDTASLQLIELMLTDDEIKYFYFIGAYRDNEVGKGHRLNVALKALSERDVVLNQINLGPLSNAQVTRLIRDATRQSQLEVIPLVTLLIDKTAGNPFFLTQFLMSLYQEQLLVFDIDEKRWRWDIEHLKVRGMTDNVVDLMLRKLQRLPEETQTVMRLAACIGNHFDLRTLAIVSDQSVLDNYEALLPALHEGMIVPMSDLQLTEEDLQSSKLLVVHLRFQHDRIQQAAYMMIDEADKVEIHRKIGQLLQNNLTIEAQEERLFEIVDHLNKGQESIQDNALKQELSMLNLSAAQKAKSSTAYEPALHYILTGIDNLPSDAWDDHYDLAFSLYIEKGEIEYLNAKWDDSIETFNYLLIHAKTKLERARINVLIMTSYRSCNNLKDALDIGVAALAELGMQVTPYPSEEELSREMEEGYAAIVAGREIDDLYDMPEMDDPVQLALLSLLMECIPPAYFLGTGMIFVIGRRMAELCVKHGNSPLAPLAYLWFASLVLICYSHDYKNAYKFGKLALKLHENKYPVKSHEAILMSPWGGYVSHHTEDINTARGHVMRGYYSGIENGAYQWAGYCAVHSLSMDYWGALTLKEMRDKIEEILPQLEKIDPNMVHYYYAVRATIHNLTAAAVKDPYLLSEEQWPDQHAFIKRSRELKDHNMLVMEALVKMTMAVWFSDYTKAADYGDIIDQYIVGIPGIYMNPVYHFHQGLVYAQIYHTPGTEDKDAGVLKKFEQIITLFSTWAETSPTTYLHQYLLLKAEYSRVQGEELNAQKYFDQCIDAVPESGFLMNRALANELAARFYIDCDRDRIAQVYLFEAHYLYGLWGLTKKVKQMETQYSNLRQKFSASSGSSAIVRTTKRGTLTTATSLDLDAVMKAARAISGEIRLEKLLERLILLILESAGAQRGFFILHKDGELFIEGAGQADSDEITVLQSAPIKGNQDLCEAVVHYVARQQKSVTLNDASHEGAYRDDPYIKQQQPKSLLCLPIVNQGELTGLIYLENNLTTRAFTPDRLQMLQMIASLAAISLENAFLYESVSREIDERKQAIEALKLSEERYALAIAGSSDGIWDWDLQTKEMILSDRFNEILGYAPGELPNVIETIVSRLHPDDYDATLRQMEQHIKAHEPYDVEYRLKTKSGEYCWYRARGQAIWDEQGMATRMSGSVQEISDLKKMEQTLRQSGQREKLLKDLAIAANENIDLDRILVTTLNYICEYTGWPIGHAYYLREEGAKELIPTKIWHLDHPEKFKKFREVTEQTSFSIDVGLPGRVLRSGEAAWISNVTEDANFPRAKLATGVCGAFAFPVIADKQVVAVLEFFSEKSESINKELLAMMAQVGLQLGTVFQRKGIEAVLAKHREQLEELGKNAAQNKAPSASSK